MTVRAKFFVQSIKPSFEEAPEATSRQVTMGAVCRGANNSAWASATPSGSLMMNVRNDFATAQFKEGKEYYLTFTEAEPAPQEFDGHELVEGKTPWGSDCCEVCGLTPTWGLDPETNTTRYFWDDAARARHDEAYAK